MQKLRNIKPVQRLTAATYGREKIVEINFPKGKYSKSDMENLIKIQQEKYKGENLMLMPSIKLDRGYRSLRAFGVDQKNAHIDLYGNESNESEHFCIYIWKGKDKAGGTDEHNDCLYDCLLKVLNFSELRESWNTKTKFKKRLGLERNDKVHVDKIPIIEQKLNININITGDYTYTSSNTNSKTANLKLVNGHYCYDASKKSNDLIKSISFKDQKIYFAYEDKDNILVYDGKNEIQMTYDNYYEIKNNIFGDIAIVKATKRDKIIEEYDNHIKCMKEVKEKSNNLIDYKNCGGSHKNAVLKLFYNMTKGIEDPEPISNLEEEWLKDCFQGGLIFGENVTLDNATSYDVNSAYPSILKNSGFKIPVKQGDFKRITEITEIVPYGIYRCIIKRSGDYHTDKLFKFNNLSKYTHTDIYIARKLKLDIQLILDDEANCLLYGAGKCINGARMFKTIIDYLYKLKTDKVKYGKIMMNTLWGALCQKNVIYKIAKDSNVYDIPDDCELIALAPNKKGDLVTYAKKGKYFKLNYARFGPFLTAVVRKLIVDTIYPHKELVHRCHTDGFICEHVIENIELSSEIGKFKIEKQGKCIIKNSMLVNWV